MIDQVLIQDDGFGRSFSCNSDGTVKVSDDAHRVLNAGPNFFSVYIDLMTKYAVADGYMGLPDGWLVFVDRGERTLDARDGATCPTSVRITGLDSKWNINSNVGRYTLSIVGVRSQAVD